MATTIAIPNMRLLIGLTDDEADRLARELARAEEDAHEPGMDGFDSFDRDAAIARRRS